MQQQWEYKILVTYIANEADQQNNLNLLGAQGWEVVAALPLIQPDTYHGSWTRQVQYILKRPKP